MQRNRPLQSRPRCSAAGAHHGAPHGDQRPCPPCPLRPRFLRLPHLPHGCPPSSPFSPLLPPPPWPAPVAPVAPGRGRLVGVGGGAPARGAPLGAAGLPGQAEPPDRSV